MQISLFKLLENVLKKKIGNNFDKTNTVQNGATGITEAYIPFLPLPSNFQKR